MLPKYPPNKVSKRGGIVWTRCKPVSLQCNISFLYCKERHVAFVFSILHENLKKCYVFNVDTKLGTGAEPDKMQQLDKMTIYEAM